MWVGDRAESGWGLISRKMLLIMSKKNTPEGVASRFVASVLWVDGGLRRTNAHSIAFYERQCSKIVACGSTATESRCGG